jgi:pimeloyl-ACP methyl ester carboxylesterase
MIASLAHTLTVPTTRTQSIPLVILHGLFGSKRNWNTISKALSNRIHSDIYALDLRNHGDAQSLPSMNYDDMARDVNAWADTHNLDQFVLFGHSMGGRIAMHMALDKLYRDRVHRLVVVDVAPCRMTISSDFGTYIRAMKRVNAVGGCTHRAQVDAMLQHAVPVRSVDVS